MCRAEFSKRSTYWLIGFGAFLLLLGVGSNFFWWKNNTGFVPANILNMLPGPILILTGFWLAKAKRFRNVVGVLGVIVAIPLIPMMLLGVYFQLYLGPHRSTKLYEFFLIRYRITPYRRVVNHFPKQIPENATDVHFFHQPHFMMGGMSLQLRCILPAEEVKRLLNESLSKAKQVQETNGDYLSHMPSLCAGEKSYVYWPKGYKIIVFGSESGNRGFDYGVAISTEKNEVVYWMED